VCCLPVGQTGSIQVIIAISEKLPKLTPKSALFLKFSRNFRIIAKYDTIFEILVKYGVGVIFSGEGFFLAST